MMSSSAFISYGWEDYALLDCGGKERLERWGKFTVVRPDPVALWRRTAPRLWEKPDAIYHRSSSGGGEWEYKKSLPESWVIRYGELSFKVSPTGFKHMGLFPEQGVNWDLIISALAGRENAHILNLFAYTGAATAAAAYAGAKVTHVDASKGVLSWANENLRLSGITSGRVRFIHDDSKKFVQREKRRKSSYDGIIMDPPSFGRGAKGEVWKLEDDLWDILKASAELISDKPIFFLINSYSAGISPLVAANMLSCLNLKLKTVAYGELLIPFGERFLPCGASCWGEF
jgi:23S rRNA (cytosine1962-C5)-methyltransferase